MTELYAPNGAEIQGTYEMVPGAASVTFADEDTRTWEHEGGTKMFWNGSETKTIDGVTLFIDDEGFEWLEHHLIPEGQKPLSHETQNLIGSEMRMGKLVESYRKTADCMKAMHQLGETDLDIRESDGVEAELTQIYRLLRDRVIVAIAKEIGGIE